MMLKIEDLHLHYGHITALRGVSLEVSKGEIVTLIGSNGAGKTSLLNAVSGLAAKAGGSVTFCDRDITQEKPERIVQSGISHIPEGRKIFPALTVYENLITGTFGNKSLTKKQIKQLIEENFELFPRLKERIRQNGGSLSGGEQQMLAIARGLMMNPSLVMLDEPSLGLAPIIVEEIFSLIRRIREQGKTVLLIEQNATMALSVADKGYVMENGRIVLSGKGSDLLHDPEVKKSYLGG